MVTGSTICPDCGWDNDHATEVDGTDKKPSAGNISVCLGCGHVSVFTGDGMNVREPKGEELIAITADPKIAVMQDLIRKRKAG